MANGRTAVETLKTEGNLNNRIGVTADIVQLAPRHQAAVIEMGVDQQGQTTRLCEIARPTVGVITNIGPDHLEFSAAWKGPRKPRPSCSIICRKTGRWC